MKMNIPNTVVYNRNSDSESNNNNNMRNSGKNMRTLLIPYIRVSTKPQSDGMSLEDQRLMLEALDESVEYVLDELISETHSARNEHEACKRSGLNKAMKLALKIGADIVVTSADRFTRTAATYKRFVAQGGVVRVLNLELSASPEVVLAAMCLAESDAEQSRRRTMAGQKRAAERGIKPGNPRIAEAREKANQVLRARTEVTDDEFNLHLQQALDDGAETSKEIARAFKRMGYKTPTGENWKHDNVRRKRASVNNRKRRQIDSDANELYSGKLTIGNDYAPHVYDDNVNQKVSTSGDFDTPLNTVMSGLAASTFHGEINGAQQQVFVAANDDEADSEIAPFSPDQMERFVQFMNFLQRKGYSIEKARNLWAKGSDPKMTRKTRNNILSVMANAARSAA